MSNPNLTITSPQQKTGVVDLLEISILNSGSDPFGGPAKPVAIVVYLWKTNPDIATKAIWAASEAAGGNDGSVALLSGITPSGGTGSWTTLVMDPSQDPNTPKGTIPVYIVNNVNAKNPSNSLTDHWGSLAAGKTLTLSLPIKMVSAKQNILLPCSYSGSLNHRHSSYERVIPSREPLRVHR